MTVFNIELYHDTVCPWCYIAHRALTHAITLYRKTYPSGSLDTFTITYAPFYLDATAPLIGIPIHDRIIQKNGAEMARGIVTRLKRVGAAHGINFSFQGKYGNSGLSHRLLKLAGTKGVDVQRRVLEGIWERCFEGDGDVTSQGLMLQVGGKVGLSEREIVEYLDSKEVKEMVDKEAAEARERGIRHVPFLVVNGVETEGARDAGEYFEILVGIKEKAA